MLLLTPQPEVTEREVKHQFYTIMSPFRLQNRSIKWS
jgi:hypothetical protein